MIISISVLPMRPDTKNPKSDLNLTQELRNINQIPQYNQTVKHKISGHRTYQILIGTYSRREIIHPRSPLNNNRDIDYRPLANRAFSKIHKASR
jgi:hypothetical protein